MGKYTSEIAAGIGPYFPLTLCIDDGTTDAADGSCKALKPDGELNPYVPPATRFTGIDLNLAYQGTLGLNANLGLGFSAGGRFKLADLANPEEYNNVEGYDANGASTGAPFPATHQEELRNAAATAVSPEVGAHLRIQSGDKTLFADIGYAAAYEWSWFNAYTGDRSGNPQEFSVSAFVHGPEVSVGYLFAANLAVKVEGSYGLQASKLKVDGGNSYTRLGGANPVNARIGLVYRF